MKATSVLRVIWATTLSGPLALAAAKSQDPPNIACTDFAADLRTMVSVDQAYRQYLMGIPRITPLTPREKIPRILRFGNIIDATNTKRLKEYLSVCGWPRISVYGVQASRDAFLLVQHADHDRQFQREALKILENLAPKGEALARNLAYLSDRLSVADGRPQLYGTQFSASGNCISGFATMDDREKVEERRKAIGLASLDSYLASARAGTSVHCTAQNKE